jgi:conjugal transfer/type IV secretion protein DotA/TraY
MAPIAGLSQLGRWTAWIALSLKGTETVAKKFLGGAVGTVGKETSGLGRAIGILADGAAFLIDALWIPLFLIGCALGWLVPALPFIRMLLSVMNWVLAFIETVLLSQLMFAQMISAEPGGLFPSAAKPLIWNTVALMVRPLLTLGGFIIGLMACSEMIGILNSVYVTMMRQTTGRQILGFFVNVAIYFGVAYVIVNTTTKTAEYLPNAAYRWLGANAGGERDDAHAVGSTILAWVQKVRSPVKAAK